ncbi:MAG: hypothetical protein AB7I52_12240 [Rhizobiaceae bacterium]
MATAVDLQRRRSALEALYGVTGSEELVAALRCYDINVPPRTEGRKSWHCENYSICRLLASIADTDLISFPFACVKRESPDYIFTMGSIEVGIEITEVIDQGFAKYCAISGERISRRLD